MTIATGSTILATDYNSYVGGNPTTTSTMFNATWATGGNTAGYGQTALANVAVAATVSAAEWANLTGKIGNCGSHQGSSGSFVSITTPVAGAVVSASGAANIANIATNISTVYSNKLNSASQGSTVGYANTRTGAWSNVLLFTHTATFANADAARFFFNSGGQLLMTFSHSTGSAIDNIINAIGTNMGTIVFSAPASGSITAGGVAGYNGITKVGGTLTPAPTVLSTNSGYYGLTNGANVSVFTQDAAGTGGYLDTFVNITMKNNGSGLGSNGDNGSVITAYTTIDEVPNGLSVTSGTVCTMTVRPPESTYIANTWGTITVTHSNSAV